MMEASTVTDFQLQDLIRPPAKRFQRHMSALVNFFRFRSDRLAEFEELVWDTEDLETKRYDLEEGSERTREEIAALVAARHAEEPMVKKLRETNLGYSDKLLRLKKEQSKLLAEVDTLKNDKAHVLQQQTNVQAELQGLHTELGRLQARLLSHPNDLKKQIGGMQEQVHTEKAHLASIESHAASLMAKVDVLAQLDTDLVHAITAMEQVAAEMERTAKEARGLDEAREAIASYEHERETLEHRIEQLDRQVQHALDRLEQARAALEEQRAASKAQLDALTTRLANVSEVRKERHAHAEKHNAASQELERELDALLQSHEAHYAKMQLAKDALCRKANAYMDAITRALP